MDGALGDLVATLSVGGFQTEDESEEFNPAITDCRPPAWTPLSKAVRLQQDSGEYLRDPNASRFPEYPTEAAIQAVFSEYPTIDTSEINLFACTSTLGNLCRWARGETKPCRFNVGCVGSTVFFIRKEASPNALIPGVRGFGHSFPQSYTTWEDRDDCLSHQRVIRYKLGSLTCLVRAEIDGYIPDKAQSGPSVSTSTPGSTTLYPKLSQPNSLSKANTDATPSTILDSPSSSLHSIPQSSLFDLKTRSMKRYPALLDDITPRLWLAQLPTLIMAYHHAGLFTKIDVEDHQSAIHEWTLNNASGLQTFERALQKIVRLAKEENESMLEVVIHGPEKLEIRRRSPGETDYGALPEALKKKWVLNSSVLSGASENDKSDTTDEDEKQGPESGDKSDQGIYSDEGDYDEFRGYHSFDEYEDDESEKDFTACSADDCGYCGHCKY
ncbi:MAG: hypothetical protein Q9160_004868 [Pyrenula sp. 1 TL-2023]